MTTQLIVTFGRYNKRPVEELLANPVYCRWLVGTPKRNTWLRISHPTIYKLVKARPPDPDEFEPPPDLEPEPELEPELEPPPLQEKENEMPALMSYTVPQVAKLLHITEPRVRAMVHRGELLDISPAEAGHTLEGHPGRHSMMICPKSLADLRARLKAAAANGNGHSPRRHRAAPPPEMPAQEETVLAQPLPLISQPEPEPESEPLPVARRPPLSEFGSFRLLLERLERVEARLERLDELEHDIVTIVAYLDLDKA